MKKLLIPAAGLFAAFAATAQAQTDITVSSKIDTEGGLLGNIIALALEDAGMPVERRLQLGGTQVVREALLAGQIDIYPEYTGTGLLNVTSAVPEPETMGLLGVGMAAFGFLQRRRRRA